MTDNRKDNVVPISIENEMQRAYLDYAMSVIVSRALPDCRDGMKPVHRRILYTMHASGNQHNKPYRKSARIVGEVMGKFHPHGDDPIYGAIARMTQDFSLLAPLIDGQGNFGSIDGDEAAAMRYTEARLTKLADFGLLQDIDKDTVDFQNNYDNSEIEPRVLPVRFPNLLINGANGIAVGMATNIPPHNMGEIIDACCAYIDNENISMDEMLQYINGPDFPTGGEILGLEKTKIAMSTGRGSIIIRGRSTIEDNRRRIVISEVPYQVNKAELVKSIEDLANEKIIEGISEIRDESNKLGIRIVLDLKKDSEPEVVLNKLYKQTQLQTSFGVNMVALKDGQPLIMNVYDMIVTFIKFREEVVRNRTKYLLQKAKDKAHTLIGLLIAVENIENIIPLIRSAKDGQIARDSLLNRRWNANSVIDILEVIKDDRNEIEGSNTNFSEAQVKSILEMRLQRLTALENTKLQDELSSLVDNIKEYISLLESRQKLMGLMKSELLEIKENFATPRRTSISQQPFEMADIDLIQQEDIVLTITRDGYIKKTALSNYKGQKRSGRGKSTMNVGDDDCVTQLIITTTHHSILFFTDLGKVYRMMAYQIPTGSLQSKGRAIVNLISVTENEKVTNVIAMPYVKFERGKKEDIEEAVEIVNEEENIEVGDEIEVVNDDSEYMIFATEKGNVRRNSVKDFYNIPSNGKIAIGLEDSDKLIGVTTCRGNDHIFLATKMGKAIRFPVSKVRVFKGRTSCGVRGIKLASQDDAVVALAIVNGIVMSNEERDCYLKINLDKRLKLSETIANDIEAGTQMGQKLLSKLEDNVLTIEMLLKLAQYEQFLLSVTSKGYGKCSSAYSYRITGRGGQGVINANLKKYTGGVIAAFPVTKSDDIVVVTQGAITIRISADEIRVSGRSSSGVKLINLHEGDIISSVSRVVGGDEEEIE